MSLWCTRDKDLRYRCHCGVHVTRICGGDVVGLMRGASEVMSCLGSSYAFPANLTGWSL